MTIVIVVHHICLISCISKLIFWIQLFCKFLSTDTLNFGSDGIGTLSHEAREAFLSALVLEGVFWFFQVLHHSFLVGENNCALTCINLNVSLLDAALILQDVLNGWIKDIKNVLFSGIRFKIGLTSFCTL